MQYLNIATHIQLFTHVIIFYDVNKTQQQHGDMYRERKYHIITVRETNVVALHCGIQYMA
jgi:hypothetical protein